MKNSILVLGATGNIGSSLVERLRENSAELIAGVPHAGMKRLAGRNIRSVELDFDNGSSLENAMSEAGILFMLLPLEQNMMIRARNIVNAAKRTGIRYIVRSSLMDAHFASEYALYRIHGRIDQLVRESGIPYCIVHPNSFMQNFIVYYRDSIVRSDSFMFSQGDARISSADVRDIAAMDAEALMNPVLHRNAEYDVTGPHAVSNTEIAEILSAAAGRTIRYVPVGPREYREDLARAGMSDWDIDMDMSLERHIRDGRSARVSLDFKRQLGREPLSFLQFARDHAAAWQKITVHA